VPRALGGRAFGKRAVFVEVAEGDASLDAFGEALSRAIRRWGGRVALTPGGSTGVITLHGSFRDPGGRELLSLSVGEGPGSRRLVLHHPPDRREDAAMALLETLGADGH
jgi:hypothetical protein